MNSEQNQIQQYTAIITRKEKISSKVYLFNVRLVHPTSIIFTPGQFISIHIAATVRRSYSIASSSLKINAIELIVDVAPGGAGSHFFQGATIGTRIKFLGPMGKFTLNKTTGPLVFLATGTGIAPLKSMIDYLIVKQLESRNLARRMIYLNWGFRFEEDVFWKEYFESLQTAHPDFRFTLMLSQPHASWAGKKGYVQDFLDATILTDSQATYYVCGGGGMVKGVVVFLERKGISRERIFFEPF